MNKKEKVVSIVTSCVMSFMFSSTCYAEPINYDDFTLGESYNSEQASVSPYGMLPVGAYYCESDRFAYIQIHSTTSATTTCTVYNVYCPEKNMYICGTGGYVYNSRYDFDIIIDSWYEYGTHDVSYDTTYFDAEYSGGKIILGGETYAMD